MKDPILFLAWQSPTTRRWFAVGRLRQLPSGSFEFVYTRGFLAARDAGMVPLAGMLLAEKRYVSESLFPHFQNRIMSSSREEFPLHLERLGLVGESNPLVILARSGGARVTDGAQFQLFAKPLSRQGPSGGTELCIQFFTHGFQYMPHDQSVFPAGAPAFLMWDFQNPHDDKALMIRSGDNRNLGYVPRFYNRILLRLRELGCSVAARIEHSNPPGSPPAYRVLCSVAAPWPSGFDPLQEYPELSPLAAQHEGT